MTWTSCSRRWQPTPTDMRQARLPLVKLAYGYVLVKLLTNSVGKPEQPTLTLKSALLTALALAGRA